MKYLLTIILLLVASPLNVFAQDKYDGRNYAPYVNFIEYDYLGEGNEYAARTVVLQYGVDEEGYYQFSVNNGGSQTVYVYQITDQGVIEHAYFPETYDMKDLRQHQDARDSQMAMVLPREIYELLEFQSGYRNQDTYRVNAVLAEFTVENVKYYDVLLLEKLDSSGNGSNLFYFAPGIGLIYQSFEQDTLRVTSSLNYFRGMSLRFLDQSQNVEE